jgi:L-ribulokinase
VPGDYHRQAQERGISVHEVLTELAAEQNVGEHGLLALDWHSGNRSVLVDHQLSGLLVGQTLATRPEEIYRALIEATAFGTRTIIEAFRSAGVPVTEFVAAGGLLKNAFLMQIYADVLGMPLSVIQSSQGPALGSAIHAAVAAGAYPDIRAAAQVMGRSEQAVTSPIRTTSPPTTRCSPTTPRCMTTSARRRRRHAPLKARRRKAAAAGRSGGPDSHEPEVEAAARSSA